MDLQKIAMDAFHDELEKIAAKKKEMTLSQQLFDKLKSPKKLFRQPRTNYTAPTSAA